MHYELTQRLGKLCVLLVVFSWMNKLVVEVLDCIGSSHLYQIIKIIFFLAWQMVLANLPHKSEKQNVRCLCGLLSLRVPPPPPPLCYFTLSSPPPVPWVAEDTKVLSCGPLKIPCVWSTLFAPLPQRKSPIWCVWSYKHKGKLTYLNQEMCLFWKKKCVFFLFFQWFCPARYFTIMNIQ